MKKLSDYFSKIYCVNLPESINRKNHMIYQFKKIDILENVEFLSAPKPEKNFFLPNMVSSGQFGCTLSHLKIIGNALKYAEGHILIFEDDIEFNLDVLEEIPQTMKYLESVGWDLLYLGGQPTKKVEKTNIKTLYKTKTMRGTYAYAINYNTLYELYEFFIAKLTDKTNKHSGICDYILGAFANTKKSYAIYPLLAKPIKTYSIIKQKEYDHNTIIEQRWKDATS